MVVEGSDKFHCPSSDFTGSMAKQIFNHMALNCCDVKTYLALKNTHNATVKEFESKPKFPISNDIITFNKVQFLSPVTSLRPVAPQRGSLRSPTCYTLDLQLAGGSAPCDSFLQ